MTTDSAPVKLWSNSSLAAKFLAIAVPLTLLVTLATFAFLQNLRTTTAEQDLQSRIEKLAEIEAASLAGPVWNFNQRQVSLVLQSMINDPDLVRIEVRDDLDGLLAEQSDENESDGTEFVVTERIYAPRNTVQAGTQIGNLSVTYSDARVREQARAQTRTAIAVTALLTLVLVISAFAALHYTVRIPLQRFMSAIQTSGDEDRYVAVDWDTQDEMGRLATAYNDLQSKQKRDENELRQIKDNLEKLVEERTVELSRAKDVAEENLQSLRKAQDRLVQSEKMASLGQMTAGIAHEIKNPLNFVNNFSALTVEMQTELAEALESAKERLTGEEKEEINELNVTIAGNLQKIREHGKRADSIVRNMLLHSRSGPSVAQVAQVNAILDEALNLSFHSSRAEIEGFNVGMFKELAEPLDTIECVAQDISRVFINIISNGMYATHQRKLSGEAGYAPEVRISSHDAGDFVEVRIQDNGGGIPKSQIDEIFTPFFTTKPAGEGTGLGLSISYDIVVTQHGGDMLVESKLGEGTTFVISLPKALTENLRNESEET